LNSPEIEPESLIFTDCFFSRMMALQVLFEQNYQKLQNDCLFTDGCCQTKKCIMLKA